MNNFTKTEPVVLDFKALIIFVQELRLFLKVFQKHINYVQEYNVFFQYSLGMFERGEGGCMLYLVKIYKVDILYFVTP